MKSLLFIPGPVAVAKPVLEAMARPMINHRGPEFAELIGRIEQRLKPIYGTNGRVVVLGSSGTGALEAAVTNFFSPSDLVLSCPVGVFGKRLASIAQTFGCEVEFLETPLGAAVDPQQLAARLSADTAKRIKGVLLTHNETSTGVQNDMRALGDALREHGALTIVDSVSGLGASEFRMDDWGYDVVAAAPQKALAAPPGLGFVAMSERALTQLANAKAHRFYFDLKKALDFADKQQTPWTPPVSQVYAVDVALDLYEKEGAANVFARHAKNAAKIRAAFERMGFTIFSKPNAHSVTVVAAQPPSGVDAPALQKTLRAQGYVLGGGQGELTGKIIRMGTMGAITQTDIDAALNAINSVALSSSRA